MQLRRTTDLPRCRSGKECPRAFLAPARSASSQNDAPREKVNKDPLAAFDAASSRQLALRCRAAPYA